MITPKRGKIYIVKHSSGLIRARFIHESIYNPINRSVLGRPQRRSTIHYVFQNVATGRDIVIKSKVKIKREVTE